MVGSVRKLASTFILACMVGCTPDYSKDDPGWGNRAAETWAKNMGEAEPKTTCHDWGYKSSSYCNVAVRDKIYSVQCYHEDHKTFCWLDK